MVDSINIVFPPPKAIQGWPNYMSVISLHFMRDLNLGSFAFYRTTQIITI